MQTTGIDLLLQALDVSLDRRKLGLAVLGFAVAGIIGGLFIGLGITIGNEAASIMLGLLGLIGVWGVAALFTGAISKMSYESLASRPPPGMGEALRYAANHLAGLLFAPLLLWVLLLAAIIVEIIVLLLGRVPAVGPILSALLFLPLVLINVFLLIFVLLGGWLVPAIISGEGTGVRQTLLRLVAIVRQAPGRLTTYLVVTYLLMVILGLALLTLMSIATIQTRILALLTRFGSAIFNYSLDPENLLFAPILRFFGPFGGFGGFGLMVGIADLLFLLAWLLLSAVVVAIPYIIFPLACACAAHISVTGGAPVPQPVPAQPPVPAPAPVAPPAVQPAPQPVPAATPAPAQPPAQEPAPAATPPAQPPPAQKPTPAPARPAPTATTNCPNCGAPLRPGATFCGQCGHKVM